MKKIDNKKILNRYYTAILYEEDKNNLKALKKIIETYQEVAWIRHDRDIKEDGEKKKPHIHVIFKVGENARHRKAIAEYLQIGENMLEGCNKDKMLLYLIHKNNPEKTQYSYEEVQGTLKQRLQELLMKNMDTKEKMQGILNAINREQILTSKDLLEYCIINNCVDILKGNQYILCRILQENVIKMKY